MIGKKTDFIIYTLGKFYSEIHKKIKIPILDVAVSKRMFINVIKKASISRLSDRMMYRHLQYIEENKLIRYANQKIRFTKKGRNYFLRIRNRFEDYFNMGMIMAKKDISKFSKQTYFKK